MGRGYVSCVHIYCVCTLLRYVYPLLIFTNYASDLQHADKEGIIETAPGMPEPEEEEEEEEKEEETNSDDGEEKSE